nr:putative ribonuclease H-like domain-containing protein [Tanacetum cinerariifolium]
MRIGASVNFSFKGIKREFSVPRTPQQNGIAKRKNRTLIEAARTLVLVIKPHNKTPYELLHGRLPSIGFMRPFGCPVTILNTLEPLGKFQGKVDEGFLVGYFVYNKAFRVFNSRTRIVQETLHVNFMENKPNVAGSGPAWLFDIDSLYQTMNYHPDITENQSNTHASFQDTEKAGDEGTQSYVLFLVSSDGSINSQNNNKDAHADGKEHDDDIQKSVSPNIHSLSSGAQTRKQGDKTENKDKGKSLVVTITEFRDLNEEFEECINNSSNGVNAAGSLVSAAGLNFINSTNDFSAVGPSNTAASPPVENSTLQDVSTSSHDADMQNLEDYTHSDDADDVGAEAGINNFESTISRSPNEFIKLSRIQVRLKLCKKSFFSLNCTKASCKSKAVSSVDQPLFRIHMDLFGPTFVKSLSKKSYCLVITDDYSRFSWVFSLASTDETPPVLKTFIIGLENLLSLKVKIIRCDNGSEFKNSDLNQFCGLKGIKREFSVPRTPQQNGIAERKNRTLIEAARTLLADSLLPIPFWAEAVNTACYIQNRVLVTKPHNKTPYELLHGRLPSIGFMRPFGCPVTILNTLDPLGKFHGKVDEGFLVGYSVCKKAGEEGTQTYVLFLVLSDGSTNSQNNNKDALVDGNEHDDDIQKSMSPDIHFTSNGAQSRKQGDKTENKDKGKSPVVTITGFKDLNAEFKECTNNSSNGVNAASSSVSTTGHNFINSTNNFSAAGPSNTAMPNVEDLTHSNDADDVGAEADINNLEFIIPVSHILTIRIYKDHPTSQIIGDLSSTTQTRSMARAVRDQ